MKEVRNDGVLEVVLTLEESLYPQVTFDLSLRNVPFVSGDEEVGQAKWENYQVLAREEVTMKVNELRSVKLRVNDLTWEKAYLVVKTHPNGHPEINNHTYAYTEIKRVASEVEVFLQTDKHEYAPGEIVDLRALVVDERVEKTPKFAHIAGTYSEGNETALLWLEVPETGFVRGNFTFDGNRWVEMQVTSNANSSDVSIATSQKVRISERNGDSEPSQKMSVRLEGLSDVSFSQPWLKGRVTLTSSEGLPLEGHCNVTIQPNRWTSIEFTRQLVERSVAVGLAGGEFEFDVVEELGAVREKAGESAKFELTAKCAHLLLGRAEEATEEVTLWRSLFKVNLLSQLPWRRQSSHTDAVVVDFLVERRDGGSVEKEEPSKGLQVRFILAEEEENRFGLPSTPFSLPIPPNGVVRLQLNLSHEMPPPSGDLIYVEVAVADEVARLPDTPVDLVPGIHVTPVDPAQLIRRGDVVRFRVRSCLIYGSVNAIFSSSKAVISSQRFSFAPKEEGGMLDEVIELTVPQNVTEGSLLLTVYGLSTNPNDIRKAGDITSVAVNLVPSHGPQYIRIVDQVDVDMSTIVTFRLEGMLGDSGVSLQAAKLESLEDSAKEKEVGERRLRCLEDGYLNDRWNLKIGIQDYSLGAVDLRKVGISGNFLLRSEILLDRHPKLVFLDVDRKAAPDENGSLTVTKTFDRLTQFGTYVVSGVTLNTKSGRNVFSNSPLMKILPPPVTLSVSVPPTVLLGETLEVLGYVKNNMATPFEGHVVLESSQDGLTEVREQLVGIKPNAYKIVRMQVTPVKIGDLQVSLQSNISSRLTATKNVKVNPRN